MSTPRLNERDALRSALDQIDSLCPWCGTTRRKLRWTGTRWQVQITHAPRCSIAWSRNHRYLATGYLISVLELWGAGIGHYNEHDLVLHRRLVIL